MNIQDVTKIRWWVRLTMLQGPFGKEYPVAALWSFKQKNILARPYSKKYAGKTTLEKFNSCCVYYCTGKTKLARKKI